MTVRTERMIVCPCHYLVYLTSDSLFFSDDSLSTAVIISHCWELNISP